MGIPHRHGTACGAGHDAAGVPWGFRDRKNSKRAAPNRSSPPPEVLQLPLPGDHATTAAEITLPPPPPPPKSITRGTLFAGSGFIINARPPKPGR